MADNNAKKNAAGDPAVPLAVVALWTSDASRRRLSDHVAVNLETELESVSDATDVVLVSTRLPVVRLRPVMTALVEAAPKSIVVLCHPGGEDIALSLIERGANGILAEGNEGGLGTAYPDSAIVEGPADQDGLISTPDTVDPELLLTGYRQRLEQAGTQSRDLAVEQVSGLPSRAAFDRVLTERARRGKLPRVGYVEFANAETILAKVDERTVHLVSRRLSLLLEGACTSAGAQLFGLGDLHYAFLADDLLDDEADVLAQQIRTIGESFRPDGIEPLRAAVGHAGPEVGDTDRTLVELAARASDAARRRGGGIVNAGKLSIDEAVDVELNAAFAAIERLEYQAGHHHANEVTELAVELASELGYFHVDVLRIRLAAQLHDIGMFGLPVETQRSRPEDLSGDELELWQSHCVRGSDYLRLSAGADIAAVARHHHESWDGSGFPEGLAGEEIPLDARLIAVVDRVVHLLHDHTMPEVIETLREEAGTRFDPSVVDALAVMYSKLPEGAAV
jgi:HD-GYP domain-containing protein (c-di-GMP phosphodiesterase class II)